MIVLYLYFKLKVESLLLESSQNSPRHTCFYTISVKALKPQVPSIFRFLVDSGHLLRI